MRKYIIVTDSCCDLTKEERREYDIEYIPMYCVYNGESHYADLDWTDEERENFYQMMKDGVRITTAQITQPEYEAYFEEKLKAGYDILYISCSSALTASVDASRRAGEGLLVNYPEAKVRTVDSLNACRGLGMLCLTASEMRAEGKSLDEVADWLEEHKLEANQECTPEKLTYLKQAGRVSAASAFFGALLSIKPIIVSDKKGRNLAVEKVKGRRNSLIRLVERMQERYIDVPYQKVSILHAVCPEDAEFLRQEVVARFPQLEGKITMSWIGPIIGATCGPGIVALYFFGKKVEDGDE